MQKNRYWTDGLKARVDVGLWAAGLEYCTGTRAKLIGKSTLDSYRVVLNDAGVEPSKSAMIGDELYSDLSGAKRLGVLTIHFRKGRAQREHSNVEPPNLTMRRLNELVCLLRKTFD